MGDELKGVHLTDRGLALCDFLFRDSAGLGLSEKESTEIGMRLIEQWDGSESLAEIYKRTESWPSEIEVKEHSPDEHAR